MPVRKTLSGLDRATVAICTEITGMPIIKHVMGFRQFSLRGLSSVTAEWSLVALAWNIKRMNVLRGV